MTFVKELAVCLLLLTSPVTWAKDKLFLDVLSANSSTVELACRYEGEKKELFFNVYSGPKACIFYKLSCQYYPQADCNLQCKESGEINVVPFLVNLDGSCQEKVHIRCSVKSVGEGQDLNLDAFRILKAQSDTPEISVNNGQLVYFGHEPVPVVCRVPNRCTTAMLEISGNGTYMSSLKKTDSKEGVRYNTTLNTDALFKNAGNYTITCKEIGNESYSSTNVTFEVHNKSTVESFHEKRGQTENGIYWVHFGIPISIILYVTLMACFVKRCSIKQMLDHLRPKPQEHRNNEEEAATHSFIIGPVYPGQDTRSKPSKNDNNGEKKDSIGSRSDHAKGMKMEIEVGLINRQLWIYAGLLHNEKTLHTHITETLTHLIRNGANPFAPFEGTTAFSVFLEESATNEQESLISCVSEFIEVASKNKFLNDMIKSVPQVILEEKTSHISSMKDVFVKKCLDIVDQNPSLRDLGDNYGRTPLHNLMEKICIDDAWKDMPKLIEGTDSLWDLMYELITTTNVNIKDKDDVTPYSWLSFWYGSVTPMDEPIWSKLSKKIEDVLAHLRDHGANVRYALQGRINITWSQARRKKFAKIQDTRGLTRDAHNQTQDKGSQHPEESEDGEKVDPLCLNTDAQNQAQENRSQHHEESEAGDNADSFGDAQDLAEDNRSQHHEEGEDGEKLDPLGSSMTTDAKNLAEDNRSQHPEESEDGENVDSLGKTQNIKGTICGIWIEDNKDVGAQISHFFENCQNQRRVHEAKVKDLSILQEGSNYRGYFAVTSTQSLKNNDFCVYLTSVLRCLALGTMKKSTFVLVVVDKNAVSLPEDDQNKTIHWPIDLQAVPRVDASSQLDDDILNQIASKLQGPPLNPGVSPFVGNVGIGLAWFVFQHNFAFMLPDITERIAKSEAYKKYAGKMSKRFIIIIPESYEIALEIRKKDIPRRKKIGDLDRGIKIERDGRLPYDLKEVVTEITNNRGNCCYCCYRYIGVPDTLEYMLESGEMTEDEVKKQYSLYTDTTKSILCDPIYHNHALVFNCKDYSTLLDDLCDLITKQNKQPPLRIDTNPRNQVARVAEGLAWTFYQLYIEKFAPGLEKAMKEKKFYRQKEMPAKYLVLLPYSCIIHSFVNDSEKESIKHVGFCAGEAMYRISNDQENYYVCAAYPFNLNVLHEMETGEIAALTPVQRAAELRIFYEVLNYLFTRASAPEWCRPFKLVYYDDDKQTGRKLSEILMDEIKESLLEEQDGGSKSTQLITVP